MKTTNFKKILSVLLCLALVAAIAATVTGCAKGNKTIGKGSKTFTFVAVDRDGKEETFEIKSDEATVGAALVANGLIAGDVSEYGLYVKTVNGQTLDYDADHMYWAFYVNGEYAMSGVDSTEITDGATYSFVATAG